MGRNNIARKNNTYVVRRMCGYNAGDFRAQVQQR